MTLASGSWPLPNVGHDLTGQLAVVTGATAGLGERFARVLAAAGATVMVAGRRVEKAEAIAASITDSGAAAYGVRLDVTDPGSVEACIAEVVEQHGVPQILVNNAGIPDAALAHKMSLDLVDAVLDTNIRGPWLMSTAVVRHLIEAGLPGRIVNISSVAATHSAGRGSALYATSKAAVSRMTETLATEWARNQINVNAIAPGSFSSEMMDGMIGRVGDPSGTFPRKRLGDPAQLDSTLLYLVAPASEFVTGTIVVVDDGQTQR